MAFGEGAGEHEIRGEDGGIVMRFDCLLTLVFLFKMGVGWEGVWAKGCCMVGLG